MPNPRVVQEALFACRGRSSPVENATTASSGRGAPTRRAADRRAKGRSSSRPLISGSRVRLRWGGRVGSLRLLCGFCGSRVVTGAPGRHRRRRDGGTARPHRGRARAPRVRVQQADAGRRPARSGGAHRGAPSGLAASARPRLRQDSTPTRGCTAQIRDTTCRRKFFAQRLIPKTSSKNIKTSPIRHRTAFFSQRVVPSNSAWEPLQIDEFRRRLSSPN
jgi:hypothetical protein